MPTSPANTPAPGPRMRSPSASRAALGCTPAGGPGRNSMLNTTMGSSTTSFIPLSSRSASRACAGTSCRRRSPRSRTGSVDASAAPTIADAAQCRLSRYRDATAMSTAGMSDPGPSTSSARRELRLTSRRSMEIASLNRTSTSASVAIAWSAGRIQREVEEVQSDRAEYGAEEEKDRDLRHASPFDDAREQRRDENDDTNECDGRGEGLAIMAVNTSRWIPADQVRLPWSSRRPRQCRYHASRRPSSR